jgi:hypothetical protein
MEKKDIKTQLINALKMIKLLSSEGGRTIKQIEESLGMSKTTTYDIKKVLEEIGFQIKKHEKTNRYEIEKKPKELQIHLSFTAEEVDLIKNSLDGKVQESALGVILDKLYVHSDLLTIPNKVLEAQFGINIANVQQAIRLKKQVMLKGYRSASSNTISDRLVEPIDLQDNYRRLYVYDVEKRAIYQYKMERIDEVVVCKESFKYFFHHRKIETDVFWIDGSPKFRLALKLQLSAFEILKEEFPRVTSFTQRLSDTEYYLEAEIARGSFLTISSFILSLPGQVEVVNPPELIGFLRERMQLYKWE